MQPIKSRPKPFAFLFPHRGHDPSTRPAVESNRAERRGAMGASWRDWCSASRASEDTAIARALALDPDVLLMVSDGAAVARSDEESCAEQSPGWRDQDNE